MRKYCLLSVLLLTFLTFSCKQKGEKPAPQKIVQIETPTDTIVPRTSITFILGQDNEFGENPYYSLANHYYRLDSADKTEFVVDSLTSILEVRDYLENHRPANGLPWGTVNLVSHGNEFIDLSVKVLPKGLRTSAQSLKEAIKAEKLKALDSTVIDSATTIYLHGCAVGNNQELLNALAVAFGGENNQAYVKASKMFEYYGYTSNNRNPKSIRHYFAKVWYAFVKADSVSEEKVILKQLKKRYPTETANWHEAINREYQANPSQAYHIILGVPVIWDDVYETKEERPVFASSEEQQIWLKKQKGFFRLVKESKVPFEYFDVKYFNITLKGANDEIYYSLRAKAKAGVMCLIQPLLAEDEDAAKYFEPFVPDAQDTLFFGFANLSATK